MTSQNRKRIILLDAQILRAEQALDKRLASNSDEIRRRTLIGNKAELYRIEQLKRKRARILKVSNDKLTREQTWRVEHDIRFKAEQEAAALLNEAHGELISASAALALTPNDSDVIARVKVARELRNQCALTLRNKQRALSNWYAKEPQSLPVDKAVSAMRQKLHATIEPFVEDKKSLALGVTAEVFKNALEDTKLPSLAGNSSNSGWDFTPTIERSESQQLLHEHSHPHTELLVQDDLVSVGNVHELLPTGNRVETRDEILARLLAANSSGSASEAAKVETSTGFNMLEALDKH